MNCSNCKWWNEQGHSANILGRLIPADHKDASLVGECRANPPHPVRGDGTSWRMFPSTVAKDWCGDFEQKLNLPKPPEPQPQPVVNKPIESIINDFKKRVGRPKKDA
jgi:hypothetical protein